TENHLRYLEKWGLIRPAAARSRDGDFTFSEIATIKQLSAELERGVPLKQVLRALLAEHQGQLELDFHASRSAPAKVVALPARSARTERRPPSDYAAAPAPTAFALLDPQAALAAKYFMEGSRLDDGDDTRIEEAAAAYRKALVIDPDMVPAIVNLANLHYAHDEL